MAYDLNDAAPQMGVGDLIPDGTFAKLKMTIRPGGRNGSTPIDAGLLKASTSSDAIMLDCEFTIVDGPFARRKFWQMYTVAGGKLDDKGQSKGWNISKSAFRAMVDSAIGLDPADMSEGAKAKRQLRGLKDLDGIVFVARIMVEPASNPAYRDANKIANVVQPNEPQYVVMKGQQVPPEPLNMKPRKAPAGAAAQAGPAWAEPDKPAAAAPAAPATAAGPAWLNG